MIFSKLLKRTSVLVLSLSGMMMVAYACGWYPDESNFLSFMRPELYNKPKTEHLAFDPSMQFYWRSYENAQAYEAKPTSQVSNLFGWMEQVGNGVA
ncbi:MAG: hypothetical protein FGM54_06245, partial [Chitinophagaceae bacterium]|nr:hypothetical protein [Chitinophagaceae bacterium]